MMNLSLRSITVHTSPSSLVRQHFIDHSRIGFHDNRIFVGWGCQPHAKPLTWRTRPPYLWPAETVCPSYTPRHWVPILVAFYDTHELRWDYSYPPVTTRRMFTLRRDI
jgi:hypothetical protein